MLTLLRRRALLSLHYKVDKELAILYSLQRNLQVSDGSWIVYETVKRLAIESHRANRNSKELDWQVLVAKMTTCFCLVY